MLKLVADEHIFFLNDLLSDYFEIEQYPGREITAQALQSADALLVRSVTHVNRALIEHSPIKFVGTTTAGTDHIDTDFLAQAGIAWSSAPGFNAESVADYVICCLAHLRKENILAKTAKRAAVIGMGHVGPAVARRLAVLGFEVLTYDPPRAERDPTFDSVAWEDICDVDLICAHCALTTSGPTPSQNMINADFLKRQRPGTVFINASRGGVTALDALREHSQHLHLCLDVWPGEPDVPLDVMARCVIATPHVAGYSLQARCRSLDHVLKPLMAMFFPDLSPDALPRIPWPTKNLKVDKNASWEDVVLSLCHPGQDTTRMKDALTQADDTPAARKAAFDYLRTHYPTNHEFAYTYCRTGQATEDDVLRALGFKGK